MAIVEALKSVRSHLTDMKNSHLAKKEANEPEVGYDFRMELLNNGISLFKQFFELGCEANIENINSFKNIANNDYLKTLVSEIASLIVENEVWLNRFLSCYPYLVIQIEEYEYIDEDECQIRSGVQFMLDLFKGVDDNADIILNTFNEDLVTDFDARIKLAKELTSFNVKKEDVPCSIPQNHTWWF